jgi:hypothetical protein
MTWHADADTLSRYAADELDDARAYSIEAHLLSCANCRGLLAPSADATVLDRAWEGIVETLDAPSPGVVERVLLALGVREHIARLLAATPSLRLSWLVAESLVLGFTVAATSAAEGTPRGDAALLAYLLIAALLPVAGIAVAYGPGMDPTYEIGRAAPMRSFRLLMIRAAAVLVVSIAIAGLGALALPTSDWSAAAWILPSLALTLATLALSTTMRPVFAAATVAVAWLAIASSVAYRLDDQLAAFRAGGQLTLVVVMAISLLMLSRHPHLYGERIEG